MRVLVADDSSTFRRVIAESIDSIPDAEVVGSAATGIAAVQRARELKPDLITLDIEMPGMNGLDVLDALRECGLRTDVIMVSAVTRRGGTLTLAALAKGAFDFITKPEAGNYTENREFIRAELAPRIRALQQRSEVRNILRSVGPQAPHATPRVVTPAPDSISSTSRTRTAKPELVLIGVSTGGPNALTSVVGNLPGDLGVPVLVVQHMPPVFTQTLAENLRRSSLLDVREAVHGESVKANHVYLAPGGRHMRLKRGAASEKKIEITDDPPENNCRPAVDYLFRSVAHHFPGTAMGVILTGMGNDGTLGLRLLKRHGCRSVVQDEASSVVFGMPRSVIEAGLADIVLPLDEIAPRITSIVKGLV